jgi:hypothetical protein
MIEGKDSQIPLPLVMFTCTGLRHAPLDWENNQGFQPKAFKSKLNADRPDLSNCFN